MTRNLAVTSWFQKFAAIFRLSFHKSKFSVTKPLRPVQLARGKQSNPKVQSSELL